MTASDKTSGVPCKCPHERLCRSCERWHLAWAERERLLAIAQRRLGSRQDAEDIVGEAIVRAAESRNLDEERIGAWLTTVTIRLCIDLQRKRSRPPKVDAAMTVAEPADVIVLDAEEGRLAVTMMQDLSPRQRAALWLRANGMAVQEIADELGVNYKSAESLLSRARASARRKLSGVACVLVGALGFMRHAAKRAGMTTAPVALAASIAITSAGFKPVFAIHTEAARATTVRPVLSAPAPASHIAAPATALKQLPLTHATNARTVTKSVASARTYLFRAEAINAGPAKTGPTSLYTTHHDRSLAKSVQMCLSGGLTISTTYVGCNSSRDR